MERKFNSSQFVLGGKIDRVICRFSGSHIAGKIRVVHDTVDGSFSGLNGNVFVGQIFNGDFQPFAHPAFFVSAGVGDSDGAVLEQYL